MAIRLNVMESNPARNIDLNGCSNKKPKDKFYLGGELCYLGFWLLARNGSMGTCTGLSCIPG